MYKMHWSGWFKHFDFVIADLICVELALFMAYACRFGTFNIIERDQYRELAVILIIIDLFVSAGMNTFKNVLKRNSIKEMIESARQVIIVMMIALMFLFFNKESQTFSRLMVGITAVFYVMLTYSARVIMKIHIRKRISRSSHAKSLVIITTTDLAGKSIDNVMKYSLDKYEISGLVIADGAVRGDEIDGIPVVAGYEDAIEYICREWVDEVLIALPQRLYPSEKLINGLHQMGVVVHTAIMQKTGSEGFEQKVSRLGNYTVLTNVVNSAEAWQVTLKRLIDIVGGLVGSVITIILIIIIGPIIKIKSPGPIFFKQTRVGLNGKKFKIIKFRSMYMDAEERKKELMSQNKMQGLMFKMDWDPRIIGSKMLPDGTCKKGIGNFIRDWSLDEFPQFFNVLKGDMSLVGTRPPTVDEWEHYEPWHRSRLAVKPGITGMWQVSGRSNITDFDEIVRLDTKYIAQWSISLDIKIILKTIKVVFKKEGAM